MFPVSFNASATVTGVEDSMSVDGVSKALEWWSEKAAEADAEMHSANLEGRRYNDGVAPSCGAPKSNTAALCLFCSSVKF